MRMIIKTMAPTGAYCRSIAWKLTFRAALRYFSDSERRDDDRWDIPGVRYECIIWEGYFGFTYGQANLHATATPPYSWS